jgi:predicted aspartyl protease
VQYRQVALLRNPKNSSGDRITAQWVGTGFESYLTLTRDVVLTIDNRTTVTRTAGQTETVRTILEF